MARSSLLLSAAVLVVGFPADPAARTTHAGPASSPQEEGVVASDLELVDWKWTSPGESAFPSWAWTPAGPPRLLATELLENDRARLVLHAVTEREDASQVLAEGSDWLLNWADIPAAAVDAGGTLLGTWLARAGPGRAYGTRFRVVGTAAGGEPRPLEDHRGPGEHGFVSLGVLAGPEEGFLALWLDGRAAEGPEGETRLYARTVARDGRLGPETLVDPRTCSCCPTSLVRLQDGGFLAAWRDRSEDEVRDIAVARFDGTAWGAPRALHADGWQLDGCPVNGPRLAAGPAGVAATWFNGAEGSVLVSFGDPSGEAFGAPLRVDDGAAVGRGDAVFLPDGALLVGWLEYGGRDSTWRVRRVTAAGEAGPSLVVDSTSSERSSGFLRMAADAQGALVATTEVQPIRRVVVRRVTIRPEGR